MANHFYKHDDFKSPANQMDAQKSMLSPLNYGILAAGPATKEKLSLAKCSNFMRDSEG